MSIRKDGATGFTLIEMLVAIIIIGVGIAGVLAAYNASVKGSADALVGKQLVAIAEEMMEEVLLRPFAIDGAAPSHSLTGCGPSASRNEFNDIRDYNGYQTTDICDIDGDAVAGLEGYGVSVVVQPYTLAGLSDALRITVTASRGDQSVVLDGFRSNYGEAGAAP